MYDKQVRRRRLTLAGFVVLSLLLLTVYFGEGSGGGLHSAQRGTLSFLGPVQEGAHRALKPVRDLFGWVGDTVDAKKERDKLEKENQQLSERVAQLSSESSTNKQLKGLLQINDTVDDLAPVPSLVISRSSTLYGSHVVIDKGRSAGVRLNQPVVNGDGLVGRISQVTRGHAQVTLVTDESFGGTGVKILGSGQQSAIGPDPNHPGQLQLKYVRDVNKIGRHDQVVTSGTIDEQLQSYYPRDVIIGTVSKIQAGDGNLDSRVQVKPAVDLGTLEWVEVLTRQQAPQTVASVVTP